MTNQLRTHPLKFSLLLAGLFFVIGCGGAASPDPTPAPSAVPTEAAPSTAEPESVSTAIPPTAAPSPTATRPPTVTPTPLPPSIEVEPYYVLEEDGRFTISEISAPSAGWLAVYPSSQSEIDADLALGFAPVEAGMTRDLPIEIDIERIRGRTIQIALHSASTPEERETFDPKNETLTFITTTEVDSPLTRPTILYETQAFDPEYGHLLLERVQAYSPGWVLVYGAESNLLGYSPVAAGANINVPVPFRYREATPDIELHLWEDRGQPGVFEPEEDRPVSLQEEPVIVTGEVILPTEIVVYDQPANDTLFVSRIVTDEPGFIVVYNDPNGDDQPDIAIGYMHIDAGLTENLEIDINEGAVSPQIHLTQHLDLNGDTLFDFPGEDQMRTFDDQIRIFSARTDLGGFIVAADQPVRNRAVTLPMVSAVGPSWIALFAADPLLPHRPGGDILGEAAIPNGISTDVVIPISDVSPGDTIFARIHSDNGDLERFEPARTDWPQQHNGRDILVSFVILEPNADNGD